MLTAELTRLATETGLSPRQVAGAFLALTAICVFLLRRAIFRTLAWLGKALVGIALFTGIASGVIIAYQRFGWIAGTCAAVLAVAFIFLAARLSSEPGGSSTESDWARQDDEDIQRREYQLREDERMRRVHDETIRRNPW